MRLVLRTLAASLACALVASGCARENNQHERGGSVSIATSPTQAVSATPSAAPGVKIFTKKELSRALLELPEVPAGFHVSTDKPGGDNPDDPPSSDNSHCSQLFHNTELSASSQPTTEVERAFASTELGPTLVHNVASFRSPADAAAALGLLRPLIAECRSWNETDSEGVISYQVTQPRFPAFGNESVAVQVAMAAHSYHLEAHLLMVRIGNNASMLVYAASSPLEPARLHALASAVTNKLTALSSQSTR